MATGAAARENVIGRFSISPGQTVLIKNLFALLASCLFILAVIVPVTGSAGSDGSITIIQPRSGVYSLGDTISFSGTNTGSDTTYLFITGPNLDARGSQIQSTHPRYSPVIDGDASTFQAVITGAGNKWIWEWNTRTVPLDTGMYTVYAAGTPRDMDHINDTRYARADFIMKRPGNAPSATGAGSAGAIPAGSRRRCIRNNNPA